MEPDGFSNAHLSAVVRRAIRDIDETSAEQCDDLLMDLLSAAWGSQPAQNQ